MISINSAEHFDSQISRAGSKLVVVDFAATWCGLCRAMAPHFERLANEYSNSTVFLKVDIDDCKDLALNQGVSGLPTFIFYKNQKVVDQIVGNHPSELEEKIKSNGKDENEEIKSISSHISKLNLTDETKTKS